MTFDWAVSPGINLGTLVGWGSLVGLCRHMYMTFELPFDL